MADWAEGMLWTSMIGVISTTVGVLYVALTLRQARAATAAAVKAAEAAVAANDTARDIGERQTRAYICIEYAEFKKPVSGSPIKASVTFKNTGQSPAYNVSGWFRIVAGEKAFFVARKDGGRRIIIHFGDIGGNVARSFPHPAESTSPYTPGIAKHIRNSGKIYVFGEISYFDAFNRSSDIRTTCFRYFYRFNTDSPEDYTMLADAEGNNST